MFAHNVGLHHCNNELLLARQPQIYCYACCIGRLRVRKKKIDDGSKTHVRTLG